MRLEPLIKYLKIRKRNIIDETGYRPAAVVIPLVMNDSISILLTKRSLKLTHHKGEISFPGGRADLSDSTKLDTALRELYEEIGIPQSEVFIIGLVDDYLSITNFHITTFVAQIPYFCPYSYNKEEIDEVYIIPLRYFLKEPKTEIYKRGDLVRKNFIYDIDRIRIFGVTAQIIKDLTHIMKESGFIEENKNFIF